MAKWLNCADIDFGNPMPRLNMRTVHRYIRSLKVKVTDVVGIAAVFETRNQIVRLTFNSQATCLTFLNEFGGLRNVTLEDREINVTIKDSNEEEKYVRIAGLPHEMDLRIIQRRLKDFGKVFDLRWERYHVVEDEFLYPVLSAWLICRMVIEKDIPSYLTIGSYRTIVKYHGQKPTCRICDEMNHIGRDCPTLRKNRMVEPVKTPLNPPTGAREKTANPQALTVEAVETVNSEQELAATSAETRRENIEEIVIDENVSIVNQETQVIPETPLEQQPQGGNESIDFSDLNFPSIYPDNPSMDVDALSDTSDQSNAPTNTKKTEPSLPPTETSKIPKAVGGNASKDSYLQTVKKSTKPVTNPTRPNVSTSTTRQVGEKALQSSSPPAEPPNKKKST